MNDLLFKPLPAEVFPHPVRAFIVDGASAIGCDTSYIALPLISGLAAAIGNSRRIELKSTWTEPAVIWTAIVGPSGTLKSPAMELALEPLMKRHSRALSEYEQARKAYETKLVEYDARLREWRSSQEPRGQPPQKPDEPVPRRYVCSDTTLEATAVLLADSPRGLLLARDELAGWVLSFDAYREGRGGDVTHWLTMHRAGELTFDRKTGDRRTIHVPAANISIAGGVQPAVLRRILSREHFDNGLAARLLLAMPPRRPKRWTENELANDARQRMAGVFDALLDLEMHTDDTGRPVPVIMCMDQEARNEWIRFYNTYAARQAEAPDCDLAAAFSKIEGYAARFALILHLARLACGEKTWDDQVDVTSLLGGIRLALWFADETERIYAAFNETTAERRLRELVEHIQAIGGQASTRDLMRGGPRFKDVATAEKALDELADLSLGTWATRPKGGKPGPETTVFRLFDMTGSPEETPSTDQIDEPVMQDHGKNQQLSPYKHSETEDKTDEAR